jgi:hypothetical protein
MVLCDFQRGRHLLWRERMGPIGRIGLMGPMFSSSGASCRRTRVQTCATLPLTTKPPPHVRFRRRENQVPFKSPNRGGTRGLHVDRVGRGNLPAPHSGQTKRAPHGLIIAPGSAIESHIPKLTGG